MSQGVAEAGAADYVLLTDADILHDPRHVSALVARAEAGRLDLVSEMVALRCETPAERALVPAFVYFFQLLYPFARVNDAREPHRRRGRRLDARAARGAGPDRRPRGDARGADRRRGARGAGSRRGGPIWLGHGVLARGRCGPIPASPTSGA